MADTHPTPIQNDIAYSRRLAWLIVGATITLPLTVFVLSHLETKQQRAIAQERAQIAEQEAKQRRAYIRSLPEIPANTLVPLWKVTSCTSAYNQPHFKEESIPYVTLDGKHYRVTDCPLRPHHPATVWGYHSLPRGALPQ